MAVFGVLVGSAWCSAGRWAGSGVPVVLLFLVLGLLGGSEGIGRVEFRDYHLAVRLGTIALVLILFDGGMNTPAAAIRRALAAGGPAGDGGRRATAGLVGLFARLLGQAWPTAFLLGAIVSSTDAAAVFSVLRGGGVQLHPRVGNTIEVESCINDPVAVVLTTALIELLTARRPHVPALVLEIPLQLVVGPGMGLAGGLHRGGLLLRHVRLTTAGLYPALTLSLGFVSFGRRRSPTGAASSPSS